MPFKYYVEKMNDEFIKIEKHVYVVEAHAQHVVVIDTVTSIACLCFGTQGGAHIDI